MEQKTIFITGASRGIGKSIALLFASRGYHTFLNCSSSVAVSYTHLTLPTKRIV